MYLLPFLSTKTKRRQRRLNLLGSFGQKLLEDLESRVLPAAVLVLANPNLETSEAGGTAQFSVTLDTQPTANVTIRVRSSNPDEGTASLDKLVFTPTNWDQSQVVSVTGVDDFHDDDDVAYSIILDKLKTKDKSFKRQDPSDVSLINRDNDVAGIIVTPTSGLETTEQGGTASFTIQLASQPMQTVRVGMHSSNIQEGTSPDARLFNKRNWNVSQTVTVTGLNDFAADGDQPYQILFSPAESGDPKYNGLVGSAVSLVNLDDDQAGLIVSPTSGLIVNEGGIKNVSVRLNSQPTSNVTVTVGVTSGDGEAFITPSELFFTPQNWTNPQMFTIHGDDEGDQDGDQPFNFTVQTTSASPIYDGLSQQVFTTIHDTTPPVPIFDGTYTGSYSGTVSAFGITTPVSGAVQFTVSGNTVAVTAPAPGSGTIDNDGSAEFSPTGGTVSGAIFSGTFTLSAGGDVSASGGWTYDLDPAFGSGTWNASRV